MSWQVHWCNSRPLTEFYRCAILQNKGNLEKMKLGLLTSFLNVASSKVTGLDRWCKFNEDKVNKMSTWKPGPGLSNEVIYKFKPIYLELSKESGFIKMQTASGSFNRMIWDQIADDTFVLLPYLEFGVYGGVLNFNTGMKACVLNYEKLGIIPGFYTLKGCKKFNDQTVTITSKITNHAQE